LACESCRVTLEDRGPKPHGPGRYEERGGGAPPWAPAHGYRAKHRYRYYPAHEVYYDTGRGLYFYYANGEWQISASLPSRIMLEVEGDKSVTLEMGTDRPFEYHPQVVQRHPPGRP
jgi:hypothetical protein